MQARPFSDEAIGAYRYRRIKGSALSRMISRYEILCRSWRGRRYEKTCRTRVTEVVSNWYHRNWKLIGAIEVKHAFMNKMSKLLIVKVEMRQKE
ncbi:hypothetical protein PIB30_090902 [Stylosanthes scabra]|uniref:Uncharacterized protein n=1 Tax=Stylosanthes scabra TaxID=79078 RepID=A0ABU6QTR9_9FABA|nr:hypothetical protein [Stylosanthes scabra]